MSAHCRALSRAARYAALAYCASPAAHNDSACSASDRCGRAAGADTISAIAAAVAATCRATPTTPIRILPPNHLLQRGTGACRAVAGAATHLVELDAGFGRMAGPLVGDGEIPRDMRSEGRVADRLRFLQRDDRAFRIVDEQPRDAAEEEHFDRIRVARLERAELAPGERVVVLAERVHRRFHVGQQLAA